jgi:predicted DNA binding CopG/RHH family protein
MRFEIAQKDAALNMRIPAVLLDAVRDNAKAKGIPCARHVHMPKKHFHRNA